jgi:aminopeptidase N
MQPLFLERLRGRDALLEEMRRRRVGLRNRKPVAPRESQDSVDSYHGDVYDKGACFLHTLRFLLGDETFFQALRRMAYPDPALEKVTDGSQVRFSDTEEIRAIAEKVSGLDLGWVFEVYLRQAELPELVVSHDQDDLSLQWKAPAGLPFPMPLPVRIDRKPTRVELPAGRASLQVPHGVPVELDPEGWVLRK